MLNRILEITEENRYISLSRGFVVIKQDSQILGQIPIDDISVLLLTAQGVTLSKNILNTLAENNCITVLCGKNYVPQSMVLPIANHCFYTKNIKMQITCTEPFKKKVWQQIVIQKIKNQALVLKLCKKDYQLVEKISSLVKSGDIDNREAYAARMYWTTLFGKDFKRDKDSEGINSLLNYGYAIMRASMTRAICSAGLIPVLGVNHHNNLNQFCLADDFFEIYRPVIDLIVYDICKNGEIIVSSENKKKLTKALWINVHTKQGNSPIFQSMQYLINSFVQGMENKNPILDFPIWEGTIDDKS
nr:type II CRISPR-associated endonuclease Cas1 [Treponema sp.]